MRIILLIMIGLSFLKAEFIRDNTNNIVIDTSTNLMWQDVNNNNNSKNWSDAITYCESSVLGGFNDWHLPNRNELKSIIDRTIKFEALSPVFLYRSTFFWSSSTLHDGQNTQAWFVNFSYGEDFTETKTKERGFRCVRLAD